MKGLLSILLGSVIMISCKSSISAQTSDSGKLTQQLTMSTLWYQQSAEMRQAYYQAYNYGKMLLDRKIEARNSAKPAAIVLDIDETVLDNSPYEAMLIKTGETYSGVTWKQWTDQARAEALPGALDFVKYAKEKGVEVFYISNRRLNELEATLKNLQVQGFPDTEEKFVLLKDKTSDKTERRNSVLESYDVLVYVGDNLTDYDEVFANRDGNMGKDQVDKHKEELLLNFVMLPNPMYGEWESAIYGNDNSISDKEKLTRRSDSLIE